MKKHLQNSTKKPQDAKVPAIKAVRKTCDAKGSGLSHFVLMDKKGRP